MPRGGRHPGDVVAFVVGEVSLVIECILHPRPPGKTVVSEIGLLPAPIAGEGLVALHVIAKVSLVRVRIGGLRQVPFCIVEVAHRIHGIAAETVPGDDVLRIELRGEAAPG